MLRVGVGEILGDAVSGVAGASVARRGGVGVGQDGDARTGGVAGRLSLSPLLFSSRILLSCAILFFV